MKRKDRAARITRWRQKMRWRRRGRPEPGAKIVTADGQRSNAEDCIRYIASSN